MLVNVKVITTAELKPGDTVELSTYFGAKRSTIRRIVETSNGVYVVFNNNTWRPLSTHGETWSKVWKDDAQ